MTLNELSAQAIANSRRWFPKLHTSTWDQVQHFMLGLCGEVGEAANLVKKVNRGDKHLSAILPDLSLELADIITYTLDLAACLNIDLDQAITEKVAICEERWGDDAKGDKPWR